MLLLPDKLASFLLSHVINRDSAIKMRAVSPVSYYDTSRGFYNFVELSKKWYSV